MFRPADTRSDLGIARLAKNPHLHNWTGPESWPFSEEDEDFHYSESEKETVDIIQKKTMPPISDYGDMSGIDRSAFHDIIKVERVSKGISPFPTMYKNRDGHLGKSGNQRSSVHGFGFYLDDQISGHNYSKQSLIDDEDDPAYTLEDIAIKQLRECVRYILLDYYE